MSEVCLFYRDPKFIATGKSLGFCDFDDFESICGGDFRLCEKLEGLREHLLDQRENSRSCKDNGEENQKPEI